MSRIEAATTRLGNRAPRRGAVRHSQLIAKKTRVKQLFMVLLIWIAVLGFGMLGFNNARSLIELAVSQVELNGSFQQVQRRQVEDLIRPHLQQGFFALQLAPIKQQLEQLEWVAEARVERRWPSGIGVVITEESPIAIWNNRDLINANGELFASSQDAGSRFHLPHLGGSSSQRDEVIGHYREFSEMLRPLGFSISSFRSDAALGVTALLSNGTEVRFGSDRLLDKMQQFLSLHSQLLGAQMDRLVYIDFRYQQGAALRWREGEVDIASQHQELASGSMI